VDHSGDHEARRAVEMRKIDPVGENSEALRLDGRASGGHGPTTTTAMASRGHTSTHAKQAVHLLFTTEGRPGDASSARSGHVGRHAPQAVHWSLIVTVGFMSGIHGG
jgi:hypothetical protein